MLERQPSDPGVVREFPYDRRSDADLVRDVAAGHEEAVTAVWRRYSSHVRRTLLGALGNDANLDDLLQEVFVSFVRNAENVREPDRLRAYLAGAAIRQARQAIRGMTRKRRSMDALELEIGHMTAAPNVRERDGLRRLQVILDELPERLRESFVLRFVEGLPAKEVAECTGSSLATAKRDIAKAQERVILKARRDPLLISYLRHGGNASDDDESDEIGEPNDEVDHTEVESHSLLHHRAIPVERDGDES